MDQLKFALIENHVCGNISTLPILEELILANNQIAMITSEISNLRSLRKLDLHNNLLTTLPASISRLPLLETLILDSNKIKELPTEVYYKKVYILIVVVNVFG